MKGDKKPKKEQAKDQENSRSLPPAIMGLIALGLVCAFAAGYIVGGLVSGSKKPVRCAPVQVALGDGSTLGGRLAGLEKSLADTAQKDNDLRFKELQKMISERRIIDITTLPIQFLDLSESSRFAAKGPKNPLLTIVEFSDYQCPYCSRMAAALDELVAQYPDKIRLVFVDRPLTSIHPYSQLAHEAGIEALAQGKFWEFYSYLFQHQSELYPKGKGKNQEEQKQFNDQAIDSLAEAAGTLGLNQEAMKAALEQGKHRDALKQTVAIVDGLNINSTPTVYINGFLMMRDPESVKKLLERSVKIK